MKTRKLLDIALSYIRRGWAPVPVPLSKKGPMIPAWQYLRITEQAAPKYFVRSGNIGIILGKASGGLVDIDLDCTEAIEFAPEFLPPTGASFGRAGKRNSHHLYRVEGHAPTIQFKDPLTGKMIVELRGDGGQTIFPGSIHESGESIEWEAEGDPSTIGYAALKKNVARLAVRCLVARYLPGAADSAGLLRALDAADPRLAEQIKKWLELPQLSAADKTEPCAPKTDLGGNSSSPPPSIVAGPRPPWLPVSAIGERLADREMLSWARYDLDDCVYQLMNQQKPGRANLLYRKAIRMGVLIAREHIDQAEVTNALCQACVCNGLVHKNGEHDVRRNIDRGFTYGATKARGAPSAQAAPDEGSGKQDGEGPASQPSSDEAEEPPPKSEEADDSRASSEDALIDELASLSVLAYAKRRKDAAKQLGIGVTALDKAVERRRADLAGEAKGEPLFSYWTVEPWLEPVGGDALIRALVHRIRSHVVMSHEAALTVALWVMFAWVHEDAAVHSPILIITSPEAECGKSTLLGIISFLTPRSLSSVGISPAVLYRSIEKWHPTLMIDEADAAFVQNEELRAVVNSGWTRGQGVLRCDGEENDPRLFSTFCPKAIGLKGKKLPDTTASRAIVIELKRKLAGETVADFRHVDDSGLQELRQQLLRWTNDNVGTLLDASPILPDGFANRVAANWQLPLAVAEAAGGEWPESAREAAALIARVKATLDESRGIQLLSDSRAAFGEEADRLFSATLIGKLITDPEKPWLEYNRGRPITQKQVANLLRAYGIVSETVWIDGKSAKGYRRAAFEDAWAHYLSD